jgi:hypothetical protein
MTMTTIRRYTYAALLTLSMFAMAPTLASGQSARGAFTLPHEVHWQNGVIPAGEYHFKTEPKGPSAMLVLSRVSGTPAGFMILVNETHEIPETKEANRITLVSRRGASYVSAMDLPEIGLTLRFATPAASTEMARAGATTTTVAQR